MSLNFFFRDFSSISATLLEGRNIFMSGHSKWHNIQKTKGAADAKRSQIFTVEGPGHTAGCAQTLAILVQQMAE